MKTGIRGLVLCAAALGWALACGRSDDGSESSEQPAQGEEVQDAGAGSVSDAGAADAGAADAGLTDAGPPTDAGPVKTPVQTVNCVAEQSGLMMRYKLLRWSDGTADVECSASSPTGVYPGEGRSSRTLAAGFDANRGICGFVGYPGSSGSIGFTRVEGELTVVNGASEIKFAGGLEVDIDDGAGTSTELKVGDNSDRDRRGSCSDSNQPPPAM
jgi:hypothetical protein